MIVATRHPFGLGRVVYDEETWAQSAAALHHSVVRFDDEAIAAHLRGAPHLDRTIFAGMRALPPGHSLLRTSAGFSTMPAPMTPRRGDLLGALYDSIAATLASGRVAVALSGGLDSAIVLALARRIDPTVPAYVVAPDLPGYSELAAAQRTASALCVDLRVVGATAEDFRDALVPALVAIEEPLYNLHPVQRLLLARVMRNDGVQHVLTGDGVDQVMTRDASADYIPLVHALTDAGGVTPHAPFLDEPVMAHLLSLPPDRDKHCIRELGSALQLHAALTHGPKQSRLAPPIDLGGPPGGDDRTRTRRACLALLARHFEVRG